MLNNEILNIVVEILRTNKPELKVKAIYAKDFICKDLNISVSEFCNIESDIEDKFDIDSFCCDNIDNYTVFDLVYEIEDHLTNKKDYGTRVLRKLIKEIKNKSIDVLAKEAREADIEYLKIVDKRGEETEIELHGTDIKISKSMGGWKATVKDLEDKM
ncbi:MAG: hypothetical protein ACOC33_04060 [bacterium]